jgi:hypothetical protein
MEIDNSFENENNINQIKMISESTKDILNDFEINQKNSTISYNNTTENKYIENMKKLELICLSRENNKKEKLNISFNLIKNNIEFIYNEINKDKDKEIQTSNLYKKRKKRNSKGIKNEK